MNKNVFFGIFFLIVGSNSFAEINCELEIKKAADKFALSDMDMTPDKSLTKIDLKRSKDNGPSVVLVTNSGGTRTGFVNVSVDEDCQIVKVEENTDM